MMDDLLQTTPITQGIRQMAVERGEQMLDEVRRRHRQMGQYTTGRTSATLRIEPTQDGFQLIGWKYAGTYDEGRRDGKMPPVQAILEWIKAKGITFSRAGSAEHYAWAIARKIAREGTMRFRRHADVWETPIKEMSADIARLETRYLAMAIQRELKRIDLNQS